MKAERAQKDHYIWEHWNLPMSKHSQEILKIIGAKKDMKIVDCAVGEGRYAMPMAAVGADVTGVDNSDFIISNLKKKLAANQLDVKIVKQDIRDTLPFKAGYFDMAVSLGTTIHIDRYEDLCEELYRVTKPGGKIVIEAYNKYHITSFLEKMYQLIDLKIRKKEFVNRIPIYLRSQKEILKPFKEKNCDIKIHGFYPVLPNALPVLGTKGGIIQWIPGLSYGLRHVKLLNPFSQVIILEIEKRP